MRTATATLLVLGLSAIRGAVVYQLGQHPLLQPQSFPALDPGAYYQLAQRVLGGDIGLGPGLYFVSPLYVYFLAAVLWVTHSLKAVLVVQIILGSASVMCVFLTAREWFGTRAAWIAATLMALCGVAMFYEAALMQSGLDIPLTSGALLALTMGSTRARPALLVAAGFLFGLEAVNRPNMLLAVGLVIVAAAIVRRWRLVVLLGAGISLVLAVVLARNVVISHQWTIASSHGGLNFLIGNNANATGMFQAVPGVRADIDGQREDTRRVAERAVGRRLSDSEVSNFFLAQSRLWIASAPIEAVQLFGWKLYLVFHADHLPLPFSYDFFASDVDSGLRFFPVGAWILMPLGLGGLGLVAIGSARRRPELWIWALFVPAYAITLALFFVSERYRLPLLPPLAVLSGAVIERLWSQRRPADLALIGALAVLVNWPIPINDGREGDRLRMVALSARAHQPADAGRWAELALSTAADATSVRESVALAFHAEGDDASALRYIRDAVTAPSASLDAKIVYVEIAPASERAAAMARLQSTDIAGEADADALGRAGAALAVAGLYPDAIRFLERAADLDRASAARWVQLGYAQLSAARLADARSSLTEAARLDPQDPTAAAGLAAANCAMGLRDEALRVALVALAIDPREPTALRVVEACRSRTFS